MSSEWFEYGIHDTVYIMIPYTAYGIRYGLNVIMRRNLELASTRVSGRMKPPLGILFGLTNIPFLCPLGGSKDAFDMGKSHLTKSPIVK